MSHKKKPAELVSVRIRCPAKNKSVVLKGADVHFSGDSAECDLCGSHGSVDMSFTCPLCNKFHDIELSSY